MTAVGSREHTHVLASEGASPFARVVCGVDATPASREAVRQAATLAGRGGRVVSVGAEPGSGDAVENDRALASALRLAEDRGAAPAAHVGAGAGPAQALLDLVTRPVRRS